VAFVIAIVTYYPVSTFLFPNFQFADNTLDLKFDASFLVVLNQGKLILAGISTFYTKSVEFASPWTERMAAYATLGVQMSVYAGLCYYNHVEHPCLVREFNAARTVSFALSFVACTGSLAMVLSWDIQHADLVTPANVTDDSIVAGISIICVGWVIVIVASSVIYYLRARRRKRAQQQKRAKFKDAVHRTVMRTAAAHIINHTIAAKTNLEKQSDFQLVGDAAAESIEEINKVAQQVAQKTSNLLKMPDMANLPETTGLTSAFAQVKALAKMKSASIQAGGGGSGEIKEAAS